ncbi:MAG: hypothetical protein U5K75_08990 [Ahrensia sp.]|nr:hypothetical protein [Ahrensia sp.]
MTDQNTMPRASTQHQRLAVMAAVRHGLAQAGGGDSFCHVTRVQPPVLSKYASAQYPDNHMPIDVVLDLDLDCGAPICTRALAAAQGYDLVLRDGAAGKSPSDPLACLSAIAKEHADVISVVIDCAADGQISEADRAQIMRQALELQSATDRLIKALGVESSKPLGAGRL